MNSKKKISLSVLIYITVIHNSLAAYAPLHLEKIGDLKLENGKIIRDCIIGYRTYGHLDEKRNNILILPTPFLTQSDFYESFIGSAGWVDTTKYYVISIDALGNGNSSSPSTSSSQNGENFPEFNIADMVNSQIKLLRKN